MTIGQKKQVFSYTVKGEIFGIWFHDPEIEGGEKVSTSQRATGVAG
jgi:hypothetical protein